MDERRDFDCLDFKLMLTALVDGTAPPDGRQTAERHALRCPACLRLLEEAESTDLMLRLSARAEPAELSADFADRVIAATRSESAVAIPESHRLGGRSWREGAAWLAAAASLTLAIVIWSGDRSSGGSGFRAGTFLTPIASPVFSGVRDETDEDRRRARAEETIVARTETMARLLHDLADALDSIEIADARDAIALEALSAKLRAGDLAARAALLRHAMPLERRADLEAAEAAIAGISTGCFDPVRIEHLQATLRTLELAQRLREAARAAPTTFAAA